MPIISSPILWKGKIRFQNYFAATVQYLNECYRTTLHCGVKTITISRAKTRGCQSAMFLLCVCILFLFLFFFSVAALRRCWEHPCRNVISIKLQSNFIEITLQQGCFPINLLHIFRTSFRKNTSEGLPLKTHTHTQQKDSNQSYFRIKWTSLDIRDWYEQKTKNFIEMVPSYDTLCTVMLD